MKLIGYLCWVFWSPHEADHSPVEALLEFVVSPDEADGSPVETFLHFVKVAVSLDVLVEDIVLTLLTLDEVVVFLLEVDLMM